MTDKMIDFLTDNAPWLALGLVVFGWFINEHFRRVSVVRQQMAEHYFALIAYVGELNNHANQLARQKKQEEWHRKHKGSIPSEGIVSPDVNITPEGEDAWVEGHRLYLKMVVYCPKDVREALHKWFGSLHAEVAIKEPKRSREGYVYEFMVACHKFLVPRYLRWRKQWQLHINDIPPPPYQ